MSEVQGLDHTSFTVSHLERSLAFYCDLLGCALTATAERRNAHIAEIVGYPDAHLKLAFLRAPGSEHVIELIEYVKPPSAPLEIEPRLIGAAHLCFLVDELRATYDRLREAGVDSFVSPPVDVDTGTPEAWSALYMRDPDGIIVELYQAPREP